MHGYSPSKALSGVLPSRLRLLFEPRDMLQEQTHLPALFSNPGMVSVFNILFTDLNADSQMC